MCVLRIEFLNSRQKFSTLVRVVRHTMPIIVIGPFLGAVLDRAVLVTVARQ